MMSTATFARIEPGAWRTYRQLRLRALHDSPDAFGTRYADVCDNPDSYWQGRLANASVERDLPLFAMYDGQPVGLAWGVMDAPDYQTAHLYQMWVAPEHRGRGLGRMLVDAVIAWAERQGARCVKLNVTCGNTSAEALYLSAGFHPTGDRQPLRPGTDLLEQEMICDLVGNAA